MTRTTTILLATAISATMLLAQRPFGPRGDGEGPQGPRTPDALVELLSLDEAQLTALRENNQAFAEAVRGVMTANREKMQQFREAVENQDATLIGQLFLERGQVREQIAELREQYRASAQQILTEQQQATLANLQQQLEQLRELAPVAGQAARLNLLEGEGPGGPGIGPRSGRRGGPGGPSFGPGSGRRGGGPGGPGDFEGAGQRMGPGGFRGAQ